MNFNETLGFSWKKLKKLLVIMKFTIILIVMFTIQLKASVYSQNTRLDLNMKNQTLMDVLKEIRNNSEFTFVYDLEDLEGIKNIDVHYKNATVEEILDDCLKNTDLTYQVIDNVVVLKQALPQPQPNLIQQFDTVNIRGIVFDEYGNPLPGVSVYFEETPEIGTATDIDGKYQITKVLERQETLVFSFLGFEAQVIEISGKNLINITLKEATVGLEGVIITGIFTRRKESFTGTATIVKSEELKAMGTQSLLKNLSLFDPSLNIRENNIAGSDPNVLPEIRLRGEAVFSAPELESIERSNLVGDPNLPVFILDDFETTIEKVVDLDMNRVESVTILKDAAATAIYGSRAANGVIVIKTIQPEAGRLQVSYGLSTDFNFPDLSSYDLLEGHELFELQKDLGLLSYVDPDERFNTVQIEKYLAEGTNTDWMAQPVRNTVGQKHSLNLMGGDNNMRYMVDLNYSDMPGVMKGSSRKTGGLAVTLSYNLNDKLVFRNRLSVDKNNQTASPYGSFDQYVRMPTYFPIHDKNGYLIRQYTYYDPINYQYDNFDVDYNPMYEASVGNLDESKYVDINNNFALDWYIKPFLRFKANISYTQNIQDDVKFQSPESSLYANTEDPESKGLYGNTTTTTEKYYGNAVLTFIKEFSGHFINASLGLNLSESQIQTIGFQAQGFAAKKLADPSYAYGYKEDGVPVSIEGTTRLVGVLGGVNYSFKNRYLMDLTYRSDGSSQFGGNDKTAGFFSAGLGWNIHKENFLENSKIISQLKIKGSYGETGSVNFSAYQAKDILQYYTDVRYTGGLGTYLVGLGNDNLKWQTTENIDLGLELALFKDKLSMTFNHYRKTTKDMVTSITTPPSLGFDSYTENLGKMENYGFEITLHTSLIQKENIRWNVYATGSQNKSKILSIGNSLKAYNEVSDKKGFFVRFVEGESNTAIYAVRSLGIDPMTGEEMFLTKDGTPTFEYNVKDKVIVGDTEPTLRGTFGTSVSYKDFDLGITFGYEFGGQLYNSTVLERVENSDKHYNVDRRVLEETWKEPGDVVMYKTNVEYGKHVTTKMSSRFIQDNNFVDLSAVNINYNVPGEICHRLYMESFRLSLNMNAIAYWSTIKRERGFSYPYARVFSLSINANF